MRRIKPEPLTAEAFAPFGDVIEARDTVHHYPINQGQTERYHDLAKLDLTGDDGKAGISIFRTTPLPSPVTIKLMEYHPRSSQAFYPLNGKPYLVVVAQKGLLDPAKIHVFKASASQGVNYHAGTWHHFSLALGAPQDFMVIDRIADDDNCVEQDLDETDWIIIEDRT